VRTTGGWAGGAALVALALALTGCSGGSAEQPDPSVEQAPDPTTALRERCLSAIPDGAELEAFTLAGATGGDLEAARIGPATNQHVAVLLPQTSGLCGWGRWATAAAEEGLTSILVNPCGYGESTCTSEEDADPLNEVAAAVAEARDGLGAERVALFGTSMGGSLTVMAAAAGADVDVWADVSGPAAWEGTELAPLAASLPADGLVVMAPSDGRALYEAAEALADAAGVPFVPGRSGHGWELLVDPVDGSVTRIGRLLTGLATGS
jgi:pimeloyl-ACP methyl ester carboxylesterase